MTTAHDHADRFTEQDRIRLSNELGVPLTDKTLPEIEATLASGRHDNTQGE